MANVSRGHVAAFFPLLIGCVLCIIALAAPNWFGKTISGNSVYFGLWKLCGSASTGEGCVTLDTDYASWLTTPQALECVNVALSIVCLALSGSLFKLNVSGLAALAGVGTILAGTFGVAGAVVFNNKRNDDRELTLLDTDWCFYLNVIGDAFLFLSGILHFVHAVVTRSRGAYEGMS